MSDRAARVLHAVEEREFLAWATHVRRCVNGCRVSLGVECAEAVPLREAVDEARVRTAPGP
ncbi:hypothetical protein [Streptomyces sp. DSM 40750]|uniref:hypothetical protein n=1 Tax=Streptomyces sp. DSM 40750 TaxID=2801030 RepID=UPI00214BE384|nr:hypothetical protein [Streptomyces sp. DSM 40750]UUU23016.1 hypothetical protein JIX55_23500 [Streptomyces sp. DSM 40750]